MGCEGLFGVSPEAELTPMWIADMDFAVLPQVQQAMKQRCDHPTFGYNTPTPSSLPALCARYGVYVLSDEVHGDMVMEGYHYTPMGLIDAIQDKLVVYTFLRGKKVIKTAA